MRLPPVTITRQQRLYILSLLDRTSSTIYPTAYSGLSRIKGICLCKGFIRKRVKGWDDKGKGWMVPVVTDTGRWIVDTIK